MKTRRLVRGRRESVWLDLRWRGQVWLVQRPATGVWAGLWSWPEFDALAAFETASLDWPGQGAALPSFTHVLTHFDWQLQPVRWTLPARTSARMQSRLQARWPSGRWFEVEAARALGLPAPLRKRL